MRTKFDIDCLDGQFRFCSLSITIKVKPILGIAGRISASTAVREPYVGSRGKLKSPVFAPGLVESRRVHSGKP
jgi:hypothetical protein